MTSCSIRMIQVSVVPDSRASRAMTRSPTWCTASRTRCACAFHRWRPCFSGVISHEGWGMKEGSPDLLGATFTGDGVNFAIRSRAATRVDVCLYDSTGERETARLTLPGRTGAVYHGFVERELARVGTLYGIRVHGIYDPREGYRFNANKLLIDPWARDIVGDPKVDESILGFDPADA